MSWQPLSAGTTSRPEDVRTACQLWWAVIGLEIVRLVLGAVDRYARRGAIADQFYRQVRNSQSQVSMAQMELAVSVLDVLALTYGLAIATAAVAGVRQLGKGWLWARSIGDVAAVVLVLGAVGSMFGLGSISGIAAVVMGAGAILQAVLACGAVFLCHRKESEAYFRIRGR
ncbi:MAG: hypothetical protein J2P18_14300 [Nocardia sp.]|nr:hypothetical protein [Nocardia sp.]